MPIKKVTERKIILLIVILALCFLLIGNREEKKRFDGLTPFKFGWKLDERMIEMPIDVQKEDGGVYTIINTLPPSFDEKMTVIFKSENIYWKVFVDGKEIESYQREDLKVGITPGDLWNVVIIPEGSAGKEIQIIMEVEFKKVSNLIRAIHYAPLEIAVKKVMMQGFLSVLVCMMIFMLSIFYILADVFAFRKENGKYALVSWSLFSVFLALWSLSQPTLVQQYLGNGLMIRVLSYATLPFVTAFGLIFLKGNFPLHHQKWVKKISISIMIWGVLVVILDAAKKVSYIKTLLITQYIIMAALIYVFIQLVISLKNYKKKSFREKIYIYGNLCLLLMAGLDLYSCYSLGAEDYSKNTRIALLIYSLCVGIDFFVEFIDYVKLSEYSKLMEKLAHQDGLTGLGNRFAFDELIEKLIKTNRKDVSIVQTDVNNVKEMNDEYGHLEGDKLLKAAAENISEVFSMGQCFRYGGDEFIVIILSTEQEIIEKSITMLKEREKEINEKKELKTPMSIAYGYATLEKGSTILDTIKRADDAMYRKKREMKNSSVPRQNR